MSPAEIGLFLGLGVVIGIIAPAVGIGGGLLMMPAFLFIFPRFGIAPDLVAHLAVGSSVGAATLMSVVSVGAHARHGAVDWQVFAGLAPGLIAGAVLGGLVAHWLPDAVLHRVFAGLMLAIALWLLVGLKPREREETRRPRVRLTVPVGFAVGAVSTMVGIGGGSMIVPFLLIAGMASAYAAGTSSAAVLVTVLTGSIVYIVAGREAANLPAWSLGYLYGPAVIGTAITAMAFAPLGARIGRKLSPQLFKRLFSLLLVAVAIKLLV
ncbi:MAG: sulfite exporter TauE/SafE family protein [Gammaproteobacteria bacterium]